MFGMSLFSRFSGCFSALAFPIDLFLWVWEQFCVNRTYETNPFRGQKDASPTVNWDFRDMQTLFCS